MSSSRVTQLILAQLFLSARGSALQDTDCFCATDSSDGDLTHKRRFSATKVDTNNGGTFYCLATAYEEMKLHDWTVRDDTVDYTLNDGSRVAVLGGGPAGSLFAFFVLDMAQRAGFRPHVDIFERREFSKFGPAGCNMCGGIISESLVQTLGAEGIMLPPSVVERGIDSYILRTEEGSVHIDTPLKEKRIASVHRGAGPKGTSERHWASFDGHLLDLAVGKGACVVRGRVEDVTLLNGKPRLASAGVEPQVYDLLAVAAGVNTSILKVFESLPICYTPPRTTATYIAEFQLGEEAVGTLLGSSMHVFLLNIPRLEFAAIIPKGEFAAVCMLGHEMDDTMFRTFLRHPLVRDCFPQGWEPTVAGCHCAPRMNIQSPPRSYADRIVFIGDAGVSRLFKDGIGSAYRTAKAAAATAVFEGISARHFRKHFAPACRKIERDNRFGRMIFMATREIQRRRCNRRGVMRMTAREQLDGQRYRRMSTVLWDTFAGSASYREIFLRTLHPGFIARLLWEVAAGLFTKIEAGEAKIRPSKEMPSNTYQPPTAQEERMEGGALGRTFVPGETILRQGDEGTCMYVIQSGEVEVVKESEDREIPLAVLRKGDFFGEMAIFENEKRLATVRALSEVRVLTVDRRNLLRRIQEDPSLAFRLVEEISRKLRETGNLMSIRAGAEHLIEIRGSKK